ncbi:histidine phosphatase family protein [Granulicoccus sp. GXG6511]|uniref:histidine phosphatase family protein n=1 Tax=Granulicoccus sp. GXG6511 TaxID=3381351 RepID=UPI003D7CBB32
MTASRMIIWRHGQTDWNLDHRWQGQVDIPLNDTGRAQARTAAPALARYGITHLFSSDLLRAAETADILGEIIGLPVTRDPRLREINVGDWAGRTKDQIGAEFTKVLIAEEAGLDVVRGGGESVRQVAARTAEALTEIGEGAPDGSVVAVVMHGLAARVGAFELMELAPDQAKAFRGLENCAWLVLDRGVRHDGVECWRLAAYNSQFFDEACPLPDRSGGL